jgi:hypothetical protein
MTANSNGWTKYLVGVLVSLLFFIVMPMLITNVIANDKDSRCRDEEIKREVQKNRNEQQQLNQEILVSLTEMKSDLKYIKQAVKV